MMRKFRIFLLLTLFALSACSSPAEENIPSDVIQPEAMQPILVDVVLVESYLTQQRLPADSLKKLAQSLYEQVAYQHQVEVDELYNSMDFYLKHPSSYKKQFQQVLDSLVMMEAELRR